MKGPDVKIVRSCARCDYFESDRCSHPNAQNVLLMSDMTPKWCPVLLQRAPPHRARPGTGRWEPWELEDTVEHCGHHGFEEYAHVGSRRWSAGLIGVAEDNDLTIEATVEHHMECDIDSYAWFTWAIEVSFCGDVVAHSFGERFVLRADAFDDCEAASSKLASVFHGPVGYLNEAITMAMSCGKEDGG